MRVRGEGQAGAGSTRGAGQRVVEVQPRAAVDLEGGPRPRRGLEQRRPVERQRIATVDDATRRMGDHVDVRMLDRRQRPLRQLFRRLAAAGVDARDDEVEAGEQVIGVVERRIGSDLELGPVEDAEGGQLAVDPGDLGALLRDSFRSQARGPRQARASGR